MNMAGRICLLILFAVVAFAANVKLFLKDGTWHLVREYEVLDDRVKYYSTERGEWEEIPKELVDLDRTKKEIVEREKEAREAAKVSDEEDRAEREARREVTKVPYEPGPYWIKGSEFVPIKQAETKIATDKKRSILKLLSPIPMIAGKGTLEVDGEAAAMRIEENRPQFYFRLSADERFGIVKMWPGKGARIVEKLTIESMIKEIFEEQQTVEVFRQQVADNLYKVWPTKPLEPGEYALVQFLPAQESKLHIQVWDFGVGPASAKGK
jgi:hypothetical protein